MYRMHLVQLELLYHNIIASLPHWTLHGLCKRVDLQRDVVYLDLKCLERCIYFFIVGVDGGEGEDDGGRSVGAAAFCWNNSRGGGPE